MELSPISSFAEDSEQAVSADEAYPMARNTVLEAYDWAFARWLVDLPPLSVLPETTIADPEMPTTYEVPGDFVALRWVEPCTKWRRDGVLIRADRTGNLMIRYTRVIKNEKLVPALVQTAMALQLANLLSPKFVGSRTKRADLQTDYATALREAKDNDVLSASAARWNDGAEAGDWANEVTA